MTSDLTVVPVAGVEARLGSDGWLWARDNRAAIDAHWADLTARMPPLYNGRILVRTSQSIDGDVFRATYAEADYAAFIAARDMGFPDPGMGNCFAMAALRAADGPFVLGLMGPQTSNAGKTYFPAGTPDPSDVRPDGAVDLAGSALRELREETGIAAEDVTVGGWHVVRDGARTALMRQMRSALGADDLKARIEAFLAAETEPELAGIRLVAAPADIDVSMPPFQAAYLRWAFAVEPEGQP